MMAGEDVIVLSGSDSEGEFAAQPARPTKRRRAAPPPPPTPPHRQPPLRAPPSPSPPPHPTAAAATKRKRDSSPGPSGSAAPKGAGAQRRRTEQQRTPPTPPSTASRRKGKGAPKPRKRTKREKKKAGHATRTGTGTGTGSGHSSGAGAAAGGAGGAAVEVDTTLAELADVNIPDTLKEVLMPFQRAGVLFGIRQEGRCLIGDDMGLGKTIQAISIMCHFKDDWPLLVVAPSSVRCCWIDELEKWLPFMSPTDFNMVRSGSDVASIPTAKITLVTYALLQQKVLFAAIEAQQFACVVADEAHYLKNRNAKRTKNLMPILKGAARTVLLTGTPALSRPEELYCQLDALRPKEFGTFWDFAKQYCNARRSRFGWDTKGASNLAELHERISGKVMIRRLKKDVLSQLPPKRRQRVTLSVTDKNALVRLQEGFDQLAQLDTDPTASQHDSNQVLQTMYKESGEAKLPGIVDYIGDLCRAGEKFIVFAYHLNVLEEIRSVVVKEKAGYMFIAGATPLAERHENIKRFQNSDKCKVAILSILAASQGITLTAASTVVFAELHWTPGLIEQAENRAHRIGQASSVNIHYLVAKGTLDDLMWRTIDRKVGVVSSTLDGFKDKLKAEQADAPAQRICPACEDPLSACTCVPALDGTAELLTLAKEFGILSSTNDIRSFFANGAANLAAKPSGAKRKRDASKPTGPWTCSRCTFLNDVCKIADKTTEPPSQCGMCGTQYSASAEGGRTEERKSDPQRPKPTPSQAAPPASQSRKSLVKFYVSRNSGRLWLFDLDGNSLKVNFHFDEVFADDFDAGLADYDRGRLRSDARGFVKAWRCLRAVEKKSLCNMVMASVSSRLAAARTDPKGLRKFGGERSTQRFTPKSMFLTSPATPSPRTSGASSISTPTGGTGAPTLASFKRRTPRRENADDPIEESSESTPGSDAEDACTQQAAQPSGKQAPESSASTAAAAAAVANPCRFCQRPMKLLPWDKQQNFCSHECWEAYSVQVGTGVRRRILELEKGICQLCDLDVNGLYRHVRALKSTDDRMQQLMQTKFSSLGPKRLDAIAKKPVQGDFWQADHINPVSEGGGECDLSNYRTLCTPCHMKETKKLNPGKKARKLEGYAAGTKDIRGFFRANKRADAD